MLSLLVGVALFVPQAPVQQPSAWQHLEWRCIGPYRGGRTVGACGVADNPHVFYAGVNHGGVWKTDDAGRTWTPIFDEQPTGSIGVLQVAPSNANVIWVGSGEGLQRPDLSTGDGVFRSTDGGKTWQHLGLHDAQQISGIAVDAQDADRAFVAVLGHPYGPSEQRGLFRTQDGGKTWQRVLYRDADTGACAVVIDPSDRNTVFAVLWEARQGPWENGSWQGPGSGLFRSRDGGSTWTQLTQGLPTVEQGLGRIGIAIARTNRQRLYAVVDAPKLGGIFRSDDAGDSWTRVANEPRLWGRGNDFAEVQVDVRDADTVFVANTSSYKSTDGGVTWTCFKGSPGGDDYHTIWQNPKHPEVMLMVGDQGASVSLNDGRTWSTWYNQPTAQLYHVICDDAFPYRVYGGQQESGSVGITSRGRDGHITFRDWHPVGGDEYAYFAPDPLHPDLVYGGKVTRFHMDTGFVENVGPDRQALGLRFLRTAPLLFSPVDKTALYLAAQCLLRTRDGGAHWDVISPDLSREQPEVPANVGKYRTPDLATMKRRGVIYTVALSPRDANRIWCGTDDGRIWRTTDGGASWQNVTPPTLTAWAKVSMLDAGHFDDDTCYAAINTIRLDDQRPHLLRTHDGGKTWTEITNGLGLGPTNTIKEDPVQKGLLFCGSERQVSFSLDDGEHWHSLRQHMPATSIRDLVVHHDDLVVGTHGRSFWILDGIGMLRSLPTLAGKPLLVPPPPAYEVERSLNTDTPLPPEEPAGQNPPDGALLDYWLPANSSKVALEIRDTAGTVVRTFASDDALVLPKAERLTVMVEWARTPQRVATTAGAHRFVWDLRGPRPAREQGEPGPGFVDDEDSLPISAIWHDTPYSRQGAWVPAGKYTVRLVVDGVVASERALDVRLDPRRAK